MRQGQPPSDAQSAALAIGALVQVFSTASTSLANRRSEASATSWGMPRKRNAVFSSKSPMTGRRASRSRKMRSGGPQTAAFDGAVHAALPRNVGSLCVGHRSLSPARSAHPATVRMMRRWQYPIPRPGKGARVGRLRTGYMSGLLDQRIRKRVRRRTRCFRRQSLSGTPRIDTAFSKSLQVITMKFQEISDYRSCLGPRSRAGEE